MTLSDPHSPVPTQDWRSTPDLGMLAVQALEREIIAMRELLFATVEGRVGKVETRLDGMDRALELLQNRADKVPSDVDVTVSNLGSVMQEQFRSIQVQFTERDVRTAETSQSSKVAVDAALQAAKEAVGAQSQASDRAIAKTEEATNKQLDQLTRLIESKSASSDDKINALKERMDRNEGKGNGMAAVLGGAGVIVGLLIAVAGTIISIASK